MTCLQLSLPVPGATPALPTLPPRLAPQALQELEQMMSNTLSMLRANAFNPTAGVGVHGAAHSPDAGEIEYASWLPNPGAIEYASWVLPKRASLR